MSVLAKVVDTALATFLSRSKRERLGLHILNVARGDGNGDPGTNGEYALLDSLTRMWRAEGTAPLIFDVGANVGVWAARALSGLPAGSRVYAFEPTPGAFRVLSTNASIQALNFALGEAEAKAPFYGSDDLPTAETNSLHKRRAEVHFGLRQSVVGQVSIKRGDEFAFSLGIDRIHFLKIDTEGHELAVLKGFSQMLQARQIDYVQFEYGSTWADSHAVLGDAFDLLTPLGYLLAKIHPNGVQFFPEYDQRQDTFAYSNYVAVRSEIADTLQQI
jgi:FkbM family methyltransferase